MPLSADSLFSLNHCPVPQGFRGLAYPWEILPQIPTLLQQLVPSLPEDYDQIAPNVWVGRGTVIADTARFTGPAVIGYDCEIRPGAYIRGNVIIGHGAVIGNSTEVKQAILFDQVQAPHFNYIGDSVLGFKAHLGAGVILSNLKSNKESVTVHYGEEVLETGLKKFGGLLADGVEVGCNAVLNPGTIVGRDSIIYPLSSVRGYVPAESIYKGSGVIVPRR
ncbi:MAG: UDP-N-acetylglucosamine pyrophosphorylase [Firmicutes bacterium]|nr:UDP-N-acetylglucosamine pyrophosphorylase [Bacillota bacterium]